MPIPLIVGGAVLAYNAWGAVREEFDLPSASDLLVSGYRAVVGPDDENDDHEDDDGDDYDDDYDEEDE